MFSILVSDPDGDTVRCRWADKDRNECGGICRNSQAVAVTQDGRSIEIDQVNRVTVWIIEIII